MSDLKVSPEGNLYQGIRDILLSARTRARRAVNDAMVQAYWQVGRLIVEDEQGGERRAEYGKRLLPRLAEPLMAEFGRRFFQTFPIWNAVRTELRWTHYRTLLRVENEATR